LSRMRTILLWDP